jgi:hypothetical protein
MSGWQRGEWHLLSKYIKFNLQLSPAYVVIAFIFVIGIVLTGNRETYNHDMAAVILQVTVLLIIPNLIFMIRHRKEKGSLLGLMAVVLIIPVPFILIAIIMRAVYL